MYSNDIQKNRSSQQWRVVLTDPNMIHIQFAQLKLHAHVQCVLPMAICFSGYLSRVL